MSFDSQGGSEVAASDVEYGEPVPEPSIQPTRDGYSFVGWFTEPSGETLWEFSTVVESDTTLYAQWKALPAPTPTAPEVPSLLAATGAPAASPWIAIGGGLLLGGAATSIAHSTRRKRR